MFDPASHHDLRNSPRLREIQEVFKAIRSPGKTTEELRRMAANLCGDLNEVERTLLQPILRKEIEKRHDDR
jgi:hypothetical protein